MRRGPERPAPPVRGAPGAGDSRPARAPARLVSLEPAPAEARIESPAAAGDGTLTSIPRVVEWPHEATHASAALSGIAKASDASVSANVIRRILSMTEP